MVKKLIFNADDFGYSHGVNLGIIESYRRGLLSSTTLMPAMSGFEHAVGLAKENPGLGIGVHLTLTCGSPLGRGYKTLTPHGEEFPRKPYYIDESTTIDLDEVEHEWTLQMERVLACGICPDHLDSHHHIHTYKGCERVFYTLAERYDLPVRNSWGCGDEYTGPHMDTPDSIDHPGTLIDYITPAGVDFSDSPIEYRDKITACLIDQVPAALGEHDVVEVMCHPAFVDFPVFAGSAFNAARSAEVDVLCDPRVRAFIQDMEDVEVANYRQVYNS